MALTATEYAQGTLNRLAAHPEYASIPSHLVRGLSDYVAGMEPGGFLKSVLANDLYEACGRADPQSLACLPELAALVNWGLPATCCGSWDNVDNWLEAKAAERKANEETAAT